MGVSMGMGIEVSACTSLPLSIKYDEYFRQMRKYSSSFIPIAIKNE